MRTLTTTILLLSGLTACKSDVNIIGSPPDSGVSNPPDAVNTQTTDRFIQIQQPAIDVLFVVDNSSSMGGEQTALATNFPIFMEYFEGSGLDYHIGMVATDVERPAFSGKLRSYNGHRYIDTKTEDVAAVFTGFKETLGNIDFSNESGRAAAYLALEVGRDSEWNVDFYRDYAELHIIFVSDADDYSGVNPVGLAEFGEWARNLKGDPSRVVMHAITGVPGDVGCASGRVGSAYLTYANATGGIVQGICEPDWAPSLDALGLQTTGLKQEFFLSKVPVLDPFTVQVRVRLPVEEGSDELVTFDFVTCMTGEDGEDGTVPDCQVTYNPGRNSVTFLEFVADPAAEVLVEYTRREDYVSTADDFLP